MCKPTLKLDTLSCQMPFKGRLGVENGLESDAQVTSNLRERCVRKAVKLSKCITLIRLSVILPSIN